MPAIDGGEEERPRTGEVLGEALRTRVQLWVVIGLMAAAFGCGVAVSQIAQRSAPAVQDVGVVEVPTAQFGDSTVAPPLSEEELQEGLPAGHPDIGSDATPTGEVPTTSPSGPVEASP